MTPKGRGMMGLVVLQQLEGHQLETSAVKHCTVTSRSLVPRSPMRHCKADS
ncbi:unnamed protein product [Staurois parvus]|uniref:Uncharacterized protein n=1 Tax=Staurois parvus TaxID=386267 RepID=A0ABN9BBN9_9NEOB|nr:unnamed protein product [Staurois parvus]